MEVRVADMGAAFRFELCGGDATYRAPLIFAYFKSPTKAVSPLCAPFIRAVTGQALWMSC